MIEMSFKEDLRDLQKHLNRYQKQQLPRATNWALNQTGNKASRAIIKQVAKEAGAPQKLLKKRKFFVTARSTFKTLAFVLAVRFGTLYLKDFGAVQTKKGVISKAWGEKKLYDGAFIVDKLGRHVFAREQKKRLPIKKLPGPRPADLATEDQLLRKAQEIIAESFPDRLAMGIKRYTRRRG